MQGWVNMLDGVEQTGLYSIFFWHDSYWICHCIIMEKHSNTPIVVFFKILMPTLRV